MLDPELLRYIGALQRQRMDPEYAGVFDTAGLVVWIGSNLPVLKRLNARHPALDRRAFEEHVKEALQYEPRFAHDTYYSTAAFESVLQKVEAACATIRVSPRNPIILASSTSIGLSPLARPSTAEHVLFAGLGTMALCNYWAKAYSMLLYEYSRRSLPNTLDQVDLSSLVQGFPDPIILMSRLLLYYAYFGTVLGFGEVSVRTEHEGLRLELLEAMEIFAIGHEVGHFVAEERRPNQGSSPDAEEAHATEFFCDQYGQAVSRWHGASESNWTCFTTTGAILYLHAGSLSLRARGKVEGGSEADTDSQSHPRTKDRIDRAFTNAVACVPDDQVDKVRGYLNEIIAVVQFVESEVFPIVVATIDEAGQ